MNPLASRVGRSSDPFDGLADRVRAPGAFPGDVRAPGAAADVRRRTADGRFAPPSAVAASERHPARSNETVPVCRFPATLGRPELHPRPGGVALGRRAPPSRPRADESVLSLRQANQLLEKLVLCARFEERAEAPSAEEPSSSSSSSSTGFSPGYEAEVWVHGAPPAPPLRSETERRDLAQALRGRLVSAGSAAAPPGAPLLRSVLAGADLDVYVDGVVVNRDSADDDAQVAMAVAVQGRASLALADGLRDGPMLEEVFVFLRVQPLPPERGAPEDALCGSLVLELQTGAQGRAMPEERRRQVVHAWKVGKITDRRKFTQTAKRPFDDAASLMQVHVCVHDLPSDPERGPLEAAVVEWFGA